MTRQPLAFATGDLSAFARALGRQLADRAGPFGHLELLNLIARAGGYGNYQHLRAQGAARARLEAPTAPAAIDHRRVERVCRQFDAAGRLIRLPARVSDQQLALWVLWADLPRGHDLSERALGTRLDRRHGFGDAATLRRMLVAAGLVSRPPDGRRYRRVERAPTADALLLVKLVNNKPALVEEMSRFLARRARNGQAPG